MAKFQKGHAPIPGSGRPKGSKRRFSYFLAEILERNEYDWEFELAEAFSTRNKDVLKMYEPWAPYLFVQMRSRELDLKPMTPEESVKNADEAIKMIQALENESHA